MRNTLRRDDGSLIILVISLFSLLLVSCSLLINVADNFLAKRQLIEIGEVAITQSAHQLSLDRYYSGNINMDSSGVDGAQFRVPIDCQLAEKAFVSEISLATLRGTNIVVSDWSCNGDEVSATLTIKKNRLIYLPFNIGSDSSEISASVGAISSIGGMRN
jgi:hypothetical protein